MVSMNTLISLALLLTFASSLLTITSSASVKVYDGLVNKEVKRSIDIHTNIEEVIVEIQVENTGKAAASAYLLAIPADKVPHLSFYRAALTKGSILTTSVVEVAASGAPEGTKFIQVTFATPVAAGDSITFQAVLVFTHTLKPFPTHISQEDAQFVQYFDNHYFFSPYTTEKQTAQVKLASSNIESRSNEKPSRTSKDTIEYGPYKDVKPFSVSKMHVHYENNFPFATFTNAVREIEVSHWGNVAVEERYDLKHTGAILKGSFSRLDYQRGRNEGSKSSFRTITAMLPYGAQDVYYRDQIGNISTSHVRPTRQGVLFEVDPRFPMFGGWKTDFFINYHLPAPYALFTDAADPNTFVLNFTFSTPFSQVVVDQLTIRVILPEGAQNIRFVTPFPVDSDSTDVRFTYLDTTGRPMVILNKANLVRYHNQYFQVVYTFSSAAIYYEPSLLIIGFFLFFVASMGYMRLELSISPSHPTLKRQGLVAELVDRLIDKYHELESHFSKAESDKSNNLFKELSSIADEIKKHDVSLAELADGLTQSLNVLRDASKVLSTTSAPDKRTKANHKLQEAAAQVEVILSDLAGL